MRIMASTAITGGTLLKVVVGALVAGLGITTAFSLLIYFADRAAIARRSERRASAVLFQAASVIALLAIGGLVAYGLILMIQKPK